MKTLNRRDFPGAQYPERIIQFGEGNFLRAFVDWQIDLLNEHTNLNSGVVVVRPIETIIPVLDLPRDELESFASAVTGRFRNPYIKHQLLSIALNGMTKFRTRILPQLLAGQKANGTLPARLTFALAALIAFYRGERNGETYPVQDDAHWLERYQQLWSQYRDRVIGTQELVAIVLAEKDHWEQDLTQVPGLVEQVANDLDAILEKGMREAVRPLC